MIIAGYYGIGKTSLIKNYDYKKYGFIYLEEDNFNKTQQNWYQDYIITAIVLSRQGYIVLIDIDRNSLNYLKQTLENMSTRQIYDKVVIVYPHMDLENDWLDKLAARREKENTLKADNAWRNCKHKFKTDVDFLSRFGQYDKDFYRLCLNDMDYDLRQEINHFLATNGIDFELRGLNPQNFGVWIKVRLDDSKNTISYICSHCKKKVSEKHAFSYKFCPYCGAEMRPLSRKKERIK